MSSIPLVASAADVPRAVRYAERNPSARWYVARRAASLGYPDAVPAEWLEAADLTPVVAASGKVKKPISAIAKMADALWDAALHPRGRDGKFIEKGGAVDISVPGWPPTRGRAVGVRKDAWGNEVLSVLIDPESHKKLQKDGHLPSGPEGTSEPISLSPKWVTAAPDQKANLPGGEDQEFDDLYWSSEIIMADLDADGQGTALEDLQKALYERIDEIEKINDPEERDRVADMLRDAVDDISGYSLGEAPEGATDADVQDLEDLKVELLGGVRARLDEISTPAGEPELIEDLPLLLLNGEPDDIMAAYAEADSNLLADIAGDFEQAGVDHPSRTGDLADQLEKVISREAEAWSYTGTPADLGVDEADWDDYVADRDSAIIEANMVVAKLRGEKFDPDSYAAPAPSAPAAEPFGTYDPKYDHLREAWYGTILDADGNQLDPEEFEAAAAALGVRNPQFSPDGDGMLMELSDERLDQLANDGAIDVEAGGYRLEVEGFESDDLASQLADLEDAPDLNESFWEVASSSFAPETLDDLRAVFDERVGETGTYLDLGDDPAWIEAMARAGDRTAKIKDPDGFHRKGFEQELEAGGYSPDQVADIMAEYDRGWEESGPNLAARFALDRRDEINTDIFDSPDSLPDAGLVGPGGEDLSTPEAPAAPGAPDTSGDYIPGADTPQAKLIYAGLYSSASNKGIDVVNAGIDQRLDALLLNPDREAAHKELAGIMTQLKLGGKQRKRYREMLDEHFGVDPDGSGSDVDAAKTISAGLASDNPLKAKLDAKIADLEAPLVSTPEAPAAPGAPNDAPKPIRVKGFTKAQTVTMRDYYGEGGVGYADADELGFDPDSIGETYIDVVDLDRAIEKLSADYADGTKWMKRNTPYKQYKTFREQGLGTPGERQAVNNVRRRLERMRKDQGESANPLAGKPKTLGGDQPALPPTLGLPAPAATPATPDVWPGPAPKPGAKIYTHPQGARIYVNPDGSMEAYGANGKKKNTTATPENLATGHGKWTELKPGTQAPTAKSTNVGPTAFDAGFAVKDLSDAELVGKYKVDLADGLDIKEARRELVRRNISIPDAAEGKLVKKTTTPATIADAESIASTAGDDSVRLMAAVDTLREARASAGLGDDTPSGKLLLAMARALNDDFVTKADGPRPLTPAYAKLYADELRMWDYEPGVDALVTALDKIAAGGPPGKA